MTDEIKILGQVISTTEDRGLPGLHVAAYDRDEKSADDFLGDAMTGRDGRFSIIVEKTDEETPIRELYARLKKGGDITKIGLPDIFFEVTANGQLIAITRTIPEVQTDLLFVQIKVDYPDVSSEPGPTAEDFRNAIAAITDIGDLTPTARDAGGRSYRGRGSEAEIQLIIDNAFTDVLGRNLKTNNAKTFTASLERAFPGQQKGDNTIHYSWNPHTYAVISELGGALSGAQASIYHQAQSAWEDLDPLIANLTSIDPTADAEKMDSLRAILRTELTELVNELGYEGGPRVQRVNYIFNLVLKPSPTGQPSLLEQLKTAFSIDRSDVITVQDEEQYTKLIIIEKRIEALHHSWQAIQDEFIGTNQGKYLGTQLVLISRSLAVVADAVEEVMDVMDSVSLGPNERQTLVLNLDTLGTMLLGDLLDWVQHFSVDEGPSLVVDGGIRGVETIHGIADQLQLLVTEAAEAKTNHTGFNRRRVRSSLEELARHLDDVRQRAYETLLPNPPQPPGKVVSNNRQKQRRVSP